MLGAPPAAMLVLVGTHDTSVKASGGLCGSHLRNAVAASAGLLALHLLTLKQLEAGGGDLQRLTLISQQQGQQGVADLAAGSRTQQPTTSHEARRAAQLQVVQQHLEHTTSTVTLLRAKAVLLCRQLKLLAVLQAVERESVFNSKTHIVQPFWKCCLQAPGDQVRGKRETRLHTEEVHQHLQQQQQQQAASNGHVQFKDAAATVHCVT